MSLHHQALEVLRPSLRTRLGIATLVGAALVATPIHHARAADDRSASRSADDAPIDTLVDRLDASRRDAHARLRVLMDATLERTMLRITEARRSMELVVQWSNELDLDALESDDEVEGTTAPEATHRAPRLEIVTNTNDPLAGL